MLYTHSIRDYNPLKAVAKIVKAGASVVRKGIASLSLFGHCGVVPKPLSDRQFAKKYLLKPLEDKLDRQYNLVKNIKLQKNGDVTFDCNKKDIEKLKKIMVQMGNGGFRDVKDCYYDNNLEEVKGKGDYLTFKLKLIKPDGRSLSNVSESEPKLD